MEIVNEPAYKVDIDLGDCKLVPESIDELISQSTSVPGVIFTMEEATPNSVLKWIGRDSFYDEEFAIFAEDLEELVLKCNAVGVEVEVL